MGAPAAFRSRVSLWCTMTLNLVYGCDHPGCNSTVTLHPNDAKDPRKGLEKWGWQVTGAQSDPKGGVPKVISCLCQQHRDDNAEPVPAS